jgi:hypothetical protein
MRPRPRSRLGRLAPALAGGLALLALGGCGGSSGSGSSTAATVSGASSTAAHAGTSTAATTTNAGHTSTISATHVQKPLRGTGGAEANDDNPSQADTGNASVAQNAENPCRLVSRARAEAILHQRLAAPQYAPLGPTCIYKKPGGKSYVTIAVEPMTLASLAPVIHKRTRVSVAGHAGYCGVYGQQTLFVGLKGGKVLAVVAPCQVAKQLAAAALAKLKA